MNSRTSRPMSRAPRRGRHTSARSRHSWRFSRLLFRDVHVEAEQLPANTFIEVLLFEQNLRGLRGKVALENELAILPQRGYGLDHGLDAVEQREVDALVVHGSE